jgi:ankyrin repeat protein
MPLLILSNRFRWVYCQLEVLRKCLPKNLRRVLKELPKSLDETYQRILKEINNANQKEAHQLLQCLAVARRPLRVEELADVLALDVDAGGIPKFNPNWRWEDHEAAVLSACSSLVSVIINDDSRVVQFSHFSVKEFLTSDRLASMEDISQFHIADEPSHAILAQACLGVLVSVDDRTDEDSVEDIALLPYACSYFVEHSRVGKVELCMKDALDCLFDLDKPHFEAVFFLLLGTDDLRPFRVPSDEDPKGVLTPAAPIFVASIIGLSGLVERLMVANPQAIGFRIQGWTLLHYVVHEKKIEVARLLLAHGADINARPDSATPPHIASLQRHVERPVDGSLEELEEIESSRQISDTDVSSEDLIGRCMYYKKESDFTPLHIAVSKGYLDMCQMLLEHKADVRAHDNSGNTPLHLAVSDDHLEIARILLKYNAEVNSRNEDGSTPLLMASSNGNIEISRLLLSHDGDAFVHDNEGNTPLHLAAVGGHLEVTRSLLKLKADVNVLNNERLTPLQRAFEGHRKRYLDIMRLLLDHGANMHDSHISALLHLAAYKGHLELARTLTERKANVNALDDEGQTPLQRALEGQRKGHLDIVRLLLDHGANMHDSHISALLHLAAYKGHLELARTLTERKANVNALDDEGSTPLHQASQGSRSGNPDIVQLVRFLLDEGADIHVRDNRGNTPLHFAASRGHLEVTRILLELKADADSLNSEGLTPLQRASEGPREGYLAIFQLFLDHGANVNVHDNRGSTLLHFAASEDHLEVARMLLERKANVNALDDEGSTPLHQASQSSRSGDPDIVQLVRLLLDDGADIHARDNRGNTPLHFAASRGHLEVARMLLELKADVNALNNEGLTPLHLAFYAPWKNPDIMRLLLDHGADANVHDKSGNTLFHVAASKGDVKLACVLLERIAEVVNSQNDDGSTAFLLALRSENLDVARLLLDHNPDVHARDVRGYTPLHFAVRNGHLDICRILLERNAEVNSQNDDGSTAFLLALRSENLDVARLLLDHNPDVHARDVRGYTPLHFAVRNGHLDICRILLERNAEVNSKTHYGSTPLHFASEHGTPDLVQLMLDHNADVHVCGADGDTLLHRAAFAGSLGISET